jgi:uncharacterized protein
MILRAYAPDDLRAIHAINQAAVPAVGSETVEDLGWIADASVITVVAEQDGEIAGFCLVLAPGTGYGSLNYRWFCERYTDFVYLDRVAISPRFARQGIGRAVYAEVERLAALACPDASDFVLEVNLEPRNDESLAFHAQLGFVEVGQQVTGKGTLVSLQAKPLR